jgi:hypothetical protein
MQLARVAVLSAVLTAGADAHPHVEPPVEESKAERDALLTSKTLTLSEGLPHPAKEAAAFAREEKRRDTLTLADFKFYKPELKPDPARDQRLRQIISDPASLAMWTQKRCGGFHPDWSVNWRSGRKDIHALVCFGCKELMILSPEQQLRYNLTPAAFKKLQAELVPLRAKRPGPPTP